MGFKKYLGQRILQALITLFIAYAIIYGVMRAAPGDPISTFYGLQAGIDFPPETKELIRHQLGLDKPVYLHFLDWITQAFRGNLGVSYVYHCPVTELVTNAALWTLRLSGVSLVVGVLIAVPLGVIAAVKHGSKTDYIARLFGVLFWSMPWFWFGIMIILAFSLYLGLFPSGGAVSLTEASAPFGQGTLLDQLWHLVLPAIVLGTSYAGFLSRVVRSSMLETLRQEYILTARSKGLKERIVIYKHAFRNAMLPVVTVVGLSMGSLLSGAAVVETVFSWPGMGRLIFDAISYRDYPTIMGTIVITSTAIVFTILIVDLIYAFIDPRIRY